METSDYTRIFIRKVLSSIKQGNNEEVDLLLKHHPFQLVYASKATLLHYFAEYGDVKMVQYLLEREYDPNAQDSTGTTPLMVAVSKKDKVIVKAFLSAGADMMLLNNNNKKALHMVFDRLYFQFYISELFYDELCKKFSSEEIAQILIDVGCQLYQACFFKNARIIEYMLEHGLPVDSTCPKSKHSALHIAVISEDVDTVKVLLKHKANPNALDHWGSTPLSSLYYYSAKHTQAKIALYNILLNAQEVSLTSCNSEGHFIIGIALTDGNNKVIRKILQTNIDFTAKDEKYGRNVLHYLALNKNSRITEELKPYINKCDINAVTSIGLTALHVAVTDGNINMIQFLLNQKAKADSVTNQCRYTPLYYAYATFKPSLEDRCEQSVQLLLQHNAETQLVFTNNNNKQITIFDVAKKNNSLERTKSVIAHLALLEGTGIPITKIISIKINSHPTLKKYLNRCRKLIRKEVSGSITLLKLLTRDEKRMARYSSNKELMLKLMHLNYKQYLKSYYSYYYNILNKRLSKGVRYRVFLDEIAAVISEIFENSVDETHLVVNKIINCLNYDESLQQLYESSKIFNSNAIKI